jgi:3-oxoacyl-[acyl-carrier-protein] synthase III
MRIAAVSHAVPSERLTNDWVLDQLRRYVGPRMAADDLAVIEHRVGRFFESAGTAVRYRLAEGERAIDFAVRAGRAALAASGVDPEDVDVVIYASVARGWLEPAMGTVIQHELGLHGATSFDVVEACAGWLRALHVLHGYFRSGTYRCGLIVNCECGSPVYRSWEGLDRESIDFRLASWTIGEAATATVVTAEGADDFHCRFRTFPEHYALCLFPLVDLAPWLPKTTAIRYEPMQLFARSRDLLAAASRKITETFQEEPMFRLRTYDIGFGHAASERVAELVTRTLGLPAERYFSTHREYGNTVSASVPLGMSLALARGRLRRGDRVLVIVGASGITVGLATFTF